MRPIERKIMQKLNDKPFSIDKIEEIVDGTSRQELKKSFPDDCHFQTTRYFAKTIVSSLLRYKLIERDGSKYIKVDKSKKA
jgi:hypothetical protein